MQHLLFHQFKNMRTVTAVNLLLLLLPFTMAANKTAYLTIAILLFFLSSFYLTINAKNLATKLEDVNYAWIIALTIPFLIGLLQCFFLNPKLRASELNNFAHFFLCIPVYLAFYLLKPNIRFFLWGCLIFTVYTMGLMIWHMAILKQARSIEPNGFLGIIPQTTLSIIFAFLATRLWMNKGSKLKNIVFPTLFLFCALCIPFITQTRSGIGLILILIILVYLVLPSKLHKKYVFSFIAIFVLIAWAVMNSHAWDRNDKTISEFEGYISKKNLTRTSTTIRLELWLAAEQIFEEHPILGVGLERYGSTLLEREAKNLTPDFGLYTHPHNDFLKFASEAGLLGILSFFLLFYVPMIAAKRCYTRRPHITNPALLLIVFLGGFFLGGLVDILFAWRTTIMLYGITISLLLSNMDKIEDGAFDESN